MKYFISHSTKDVSSCELIVDLLEKASLVVNKENDILLSSIPELGLEYNTRLLDSIDLNLSISEYIILVITENYLRSPYCLYEMHLSSMYLRKVKKVIIITENSSILRKISRFFPDQLVVIADEDGANIKLVDSLIHGNDIDNILKNKLYEIALNFVDGVKKSIFISRPFIGMSESVYQNTLKFIEDEKIDRITFELPANKTTIEEKLIGSKDIFFVSTTGQSFLKVFKDNLSKAVSNGANLTIVIADKYSDFSLDVAKFEEFYNSKNIDVPRVGFLNEYDMTIGMLYEIYSLAKKNNSNKLGIIRVCSAFSLIRQTAFVIKYENDYSWGWISCTMPPMRAADSTPSIVFHGNIKNDNKNETKKNFATDVWNYCYEMSEFAIKQNAYLEINDMGLSIETNEVINDKKFNNLSPEMSKLMASEYWNKKYQLAKDEIERRSECGDEEYILIEVAAQHPLNKDGTPGKEFEKRLDKAFELYNEYKNRCKSVNIYVPGSKHMDKNKNIDIQSLSLSGTKYLEAKGVDKKNLLGENENNKYKGSDGVYNSADECYVCSQIFKNDSYTKLICVCSINQIMRKEFLYLEFGILPIFIGVTPSGGMFHGNFVGEYFTSLYDVVYSDHSWQDRNSKHALRTRLERCPLFIK